MYIMCILCAEPPYLVEANGHLLTQSFPTRNATANANAPTNSDFKYMLLGYKKAYKNSVALRM